VDRRRQLIRRASDFLRTHAAEGVRIGRVSRAAGISERALRNAFYRDYGLSPKQYELRERLRAAHDALCDVTQQRVPEPLVHVTANDQQRVP